MKVVASLTTRPKYRENFNICLDSLISQFDDVYLGLPKISRKGVKYDNFEYKSVKVVKLEEDIGPATKILAGFIMEKDNDTLIVSVDDDNEYHPNIRKSLEKQYLNDKENNQCRIIANAGHYIKYWNFGILGLNGGGISSEDRFYDMDSIVKLTKISGFGGVAYPRRVIDDVDDFISFIKNVSKDKPSTIMHDDITISAYFSNKKVDMILNPDRHSNIKTFLTRGENDEYIGEDHNSVLTYANDLKPYFNNNPWKPFSIVFVDVIIVIVIILILFLFLRYK